MRQLEGGWLSNIALDRSKQRIQRLPYIKKVDPETTPGAGLRRTWWTSTSRSRRARAPSSAAASATPSRSSFILNGNFVDANFMGTGKRIALDLNARHATARSTASQHTNPYVTVDDLSRTLSLTYRDVTQFVVRVLGLSTRRRSRRA